MLVIVKWILVIFATFVDMVVVAARSSSNVDPQVDDYYRGAADVVKNLVSFSNTELHILSDFKTSRQLEFANELSEQGKIRMPHAFAPCRLHFQGSSFQIKIYVLAWA